MPINIEFPKAFDPISFMCSFSEKLNDNENMKSALLGMQDSIRQAKLLDAEPLGLFACITAEEEAACFLYYALLQKGYSVPNYGKIQRHGDKVKILMLAQTMHHFFFEELHDDFPLTVRMQDINGNLKITAWMMISLGEDGFTATMDDPLSMIKTIGDGEDGHDNAVKSAVQDVIEEIVPPNMHIKHQIKNLSQRRDMCLYGDPQKKPKLTTDQVNHFLGNCIAITALGFMIINSESVSVSVEKIVQSFFKKLKESLTD